MYPVIKQILEQTNSFLKLFENVSYILNLCLPPTFMNCMLFDKNAFHPIKILMDFLQLFKLSLSILNEHRRDMKPSNWSKNIHKIFICSLITTLVNIHLCVKFTTIVHYSS